MKSLILFTFSLLVVGNSFSYIHSRRFFKAASLTILKCTPAENTSPTTTELTIKSKLSNAMKAAMKAKDKQLLGAIRGIQTAIKQKEVDDRIEVDDNIAIEIMAKMLKQRKESIKSYSDAGRMDLVELEENECKVISSYMPQPFTPEEIQQAIEEAVVRLEAKSIKDMAKVMADLRPKLSGKADMSEVGASIKKRLA